VSQIFKGKTYQDLKQARLLMVGDPQALIQWIR